MELAQLAGPKNKFVVMVLAVMLAMFAAGCKKKQPVVAAPPPPPPPKVEPQKPAAPVVATFEAEPGTIERGQAATLRWNVSGETNSIRIEPAIGPVNASGTRQVFPGNTTTYTLTASGPGGDATATASVNVTTPAAPPPPPPAKPKRTISEILSQDVQDAYFDYDKSNLRDDGRSALTQDAGVLKQLFTDNTGLNLVLEGHADERGSAEYNLGLADRRATAAKEFLIEMGVSGEHLKPVSYGKERPQCTESNETCWQKNRRAHVSAGQ